MSEPKTRPTTVPVADFLAGQPPARRADCETLVAMMEASTGEPATMWGQAIVGFGRYVPSHATGKPYDWPIVGFSPRKTDLTLYLMDGFDSHAGLMARLGKHRTGRSCLYLKRLADVDTDVLRELVDASVGAMASKRMRPAG